VNEATYFAIGLLTASLWAQTAPDPEVISREAVESVLKPKDIDQLLKSIGDW
jgi:hypothetical protein